MNKVPEVTILLYCPRALGCLMQQVPVTVAPSSFPQHKRQSNFLTGYPLSNETPSRSGLQESGTPPAIPCVAHSEVGPSRNGSLLKNGETFVVERSTLNTNRSVISPPSAPVPAPAVYGPPNLDQNEGIVGCVLHSRLVLYFTQ